MDSGKFNLSLLMSNLEQAHNYLKSNKDIQLAPMQNVLLQLTKLFKQINPLLGIAFKDVHDKVGFIRDNRANFPGLSTLFPTVRKEVQLDIHNCNGGNNHKFPCPEQCKKGYNSTARSFNRMMWFMTFLKVIFEKSLEQKRQKLSKILDHAYDVAFSKHHGWIVRSSAKLAIMATPGQETLIKAFIGKYDEPEFLVTATKFHSMLDPIVTAAWVFYKDNNIEELQ